ncbi:MAG: hypothetical protein QM698_06605 [Micropepsaceae bacterium]
MEEAHVFDWVITEDRGLVHLIENGAEDFFVRDDLRWIGGTIRSLRHGTRFPHEFPDAESVDARFDAHQERLAAMGVRWRALMETSERILFVRAHAWEKNPQTTAGTLRDALRAAGPRLDFTLLYLTPPEEFDPSWRNDGVAHRAVRQPEPYTWKGDDMVWDGLLREAGALS